MAGRLTATRRGALVHWCVVGLADTLKVSRLVIITARFGDTQAGTRIEAQATGPAELGCSGNEVKKLYYYFCLLERHITNVVNIV